MHHQFDDMLGNVPTHIIIQAQARQNNFRIIAQFLRLVGKVIRVHTDAVAANKPGTKRGIEVRSP